MIYECHGHIILDSVAYAGAVARHEKNVDEIFVRQNLMTCAENGIVFYRDGGDKHGVSVFAKKIACEYGIDYRTPAYIIHKKGYYGGMFGVAFENMSEYRKLISDAIRLGADFIKLTASGMLDLAGGGDVAGHSMSGTELCELVNVAHGEGLSVMIHANGADNIKRAAEAGADSIEHGFYMDRDALGIMAHTGAVWTPTVVTISNLIGSGRYNDEMLVRLFDDHKNALMDAAAIGVPVACGSDAGAALVPQGTGAHNELSVLESLGIDPGPGNHRIMEVFKRKC